MRSHLTTHDFERLVGAGIKAFGLVVQIGLNIREYAADNDITMTEQDLADVLCEVWKRVR